MPRRESEWTSIVALLQRARNITSIVASQAYLRAKILDSACSRMYNPFCNRRYVVGSSESHHLRARSSAAERPAHNRLVAGSNPAEPTFKANYQQIPPEFYENAQVQPLTPELLQLRELMYIFLGNKGRRHLELRQERVISLEI